MTRSSPPGGARPLLVVAALAAALLGRVLHDVEEFGTVSGDWLITGLLIPVGLTAAWWLWGQNLAWTGGLLVAWLALSAVVGGLLSVLPLPFWPFEPAQTVSHYGGHVVYAASQVPLGWLVVRARRR